MNKESLRLGGNTHEDDLRFVANELEHEGYCCELNTTGGLWTSRVTSHIPLKDVASLITEEGILDAVKMAHQTLWMLVFLCPGLVWQHLIPMPVTE